MLLYSMLTAPPIFSTYSFKMANRSFHFRTLLYRLPLLKKCSHQIAYKADLALARSDSVLQSKNIRDRPYMTSRPYRRSTSYYWTKDYRTKDYRCLYYRNVILSKCIIIEVLKIRLIIKVPPKAGVQGAAAPWTSGWPIAGVQGAAAPWITIQTPLKRGSGVEPPVREHIDQELIRLVRLG